MTDNIVARSRHYDNSPPMWARWSDAVRDGNGPKSLGLECTQAALNRFAARYRVAKSFQGVTLRGFAQGTVAGYGALFRLFLTWSAFEQYLNALSCKQADCGKLIARHVTPHVVGTIRRLDVDNKLYRLVISKSHGETVRQLSCYLDKKPFNHSYLASSVRHIFAHGMLTPNANRATPDAVAKICELLAHAHLHATGDDFGHRVNNFLQRERRTSA